MAWYYMNGQERVGPINEAEFEVLVNDGAVTPETYVWRESMTNWMRYGEAVTRAEGMDAQPSGQTDAPTQQLCSECGNLFPPSEMVRYSDTFICAACKPVFFQRLKEGAQLPMVAMAYGGFWIRFAAKFIDGIILWIANSAIGFILGLAIGGSGGDAPGPDMAAMLISMSLGYVIGVTYVTWFIGKFAATPGKMACGLKVVTADGGQVTYLRAFARYFAEILSSLICLIGYIMAAFDEEKRTLHDRICDTRVIRT